MSDVNLNNLYVTKRNGLVEKYDIEKIHKVLSWAAEGLDVSISEVELNARIQFVDKITTISIHETLVKTTADLISLDSPDYQYFAARLALFHIRKKAFKKFECPSLYEQITTQTQTKKYDPQILEKYSKEDIDQLDKLIDHNKDLKFSYSAITQIERKYLVQNRVTREVFESPQFIFMLVGMVLFINEDKAHRLNWVKRFYIATSEHKISLPTPIMSGVRTPTRQFSSCVLIECGDSLNSINATASAIVKYVSQRAGIGVNIGRIRAEGSPIRGGEANHTGVIPFLKLFQAAVKSCSQGGVRGGAATVFYPIWHLQVESLLVLKNNKGIEDNRVRHLDYGVQISKLFYKRLTTDGNITLFSPSDVPGLYDAFFEDNIEFERLYEKYEQDSKIRKKTVKATELFNSLAQERAQTGRLYIHNVDISNKHSAFNSKKAPVRQSNLCLEITLPTKPLNNINDSEGEIALCTLSAINLGAIGSIEEIESLSQIIVRALDNLLDYQNYPVPAAYEATKKRRTLGVGVTNFSYYLAKNNCKYSDGSANQLTHRTFEALQYYLLKTSNQLASERGACPNFSDTNYADGLLPIDTYPKSFDKAIGETFILEQDWETLRKDIIKHGLRNSTLSAQMPCETSSQVTNSTNGIEPPRNYLSIKTSKDGVLPQIVPEYNSLKEKYELLWNMPDNNGYIKLCAIMQKFIDQAISSNTNYNPARFSNGKLPITVIIRDLLTCYRLGLKTLYYHNTKDNSEDASIKNFDSYMNNAANSRTNNDIANNRHQSNSCDGEGCAL